MLEYFLQGRNHFQVVPEKPKLSLFLKSFCKYEKRCHIYFINKCFFIDEAVGVCCVLVFVMSQMVWYRESIMGNHPCKMTNTIAFDRHEALTSACRGCHTVFHLSEHKHCIHVYTQCPWSELPVVDSISTMICFTHYCKHFKYICVYVHSGIMIAMSLYNEVGWGWVGILV